MTGFLSPEGEFYQCNTYGHITLADDILKEKYNIEANLSVEELCSHGWVVIQAGFIGFTYGARNDLKFTKEQDKFLLSHMNDFSYGQQLSLNTTMEISNMLKEG